MLIGITGGSGSGKSAAARVFAENGAHIIDADKEARTVTKKGSPALSDIKKSFGSEYIGDDCELQRKKLGSLVFSDRKKLDELNKIINKYIRLDIDEKIKNAESSIVVLDAPLLIEYGLDKKCDYVIAVLADRDIRIKRITERDGLSYEDAENRINSQKNDEYYLEKADYIVYNNHTEEDIKSQIYKIIRELKEKQ